MRQIYGTPLWPNYLFVLGVLLAVLVVGACGSATHQTATTTGMTSISNATSQDADTKSSSHVPTREDTFGDYDDDDDYYRNRGTNDGDNDDRAKPGDRDNDGDSGGHGYYDSDDDSVRKFGRPATSAERRSILALLRRYDAAAIAGDGVSGCSMLYRRFALTYPKDLGEHGPHYLRGLKTCADIVARMFEANHLQLATYSRQFKIAGVRVSGRVGLVVLAFEGLPGRQIEVIREAYTWRMYAPLDSELP